MMEETATAIEVSYPAIERVGLMATSGTVAAALYQEWFARHHIEVVVPDDETQEQCVMRAIHEVKAGHTGPDVTAIVGEAARYLVEHGAEAVITGCTELPLVFKDGDASVPVIDPTSTLADAVVRQARSLAETGMRKD
jgi:aspartate racemase